MVNHSRVIKLLEDYKEWKSECFECIEEIDNGRTELLQKLTKALENPYEEIFPEFSVTRPPNYDDISGCSMLSCSS